MTLKRQLVLLVLALVATPSFAAPRITASETQVDFGPLYQGETATHVFTFGNSGDAPLKIEKVRSSCGCTAAIASQKTLAPGERGEVKVTFNSARFRGPVAKKVYLYSNDPQRKTFEFGLAATVKELITRTPHRVSDGPVQPGQTYTSTIELTNQWTGPVHFTKVQSGLPQLAARLQQTSLAPGNKTKLEIELTPDTTQRRINTYIILRTDNSLLPEIRIPVFLLVALKSG